MARMTRDERQELGLWRLEVVAYLLGVDPTSGLQEIEYGVAVMRGAQLMHTWGVGSLEEALKSALSLRTRKEVSPVKGRAIPPSQVQVCIAAKYLLKNDEFRHELERLVSHSKGAA